MNIKDNITFILQKKGLTQVDLANMLGVSKQSVQHYLNGNTTLSVVQKIAVVLDTTVETIVSETPLYLKEDIIPKRGNTTATKLVCPHCGEEITLIAK